MANRSSHYSHGFSWRLKSSAGKHVSSNYYGQMEFFFLKNKSFIFALLPSNSTFLCARKTLVCYYNKSA